MNGTQDFMILQGGIWEKDITFISIINFSWNSTSISSSEKIICFGLLAMVILHFSFHMKNSE